MTESATHIHQPFRSKGNRSVLFLTPSLQIGGEELSTLSMARELKRRNTEVFWMSAGGPLLSEIEEEIEHVNGRVNGRQFLSFFQGACDIRRFVKYRFIDIIHSQEVIPTFMSILACRLFPLAYRPLIIWHDRGIQEKSYAIAGWLFNYLVDFVITNSDFERDKLIENGMRPKKLKTVHNCINTTFPTKVWEDKDLLKDFGIQENEIVIGAVSRLHPEKGGYGTFFQAAGKILERIPGAKFLIVGGGPLEENLKELASTLGIEKSVVFTGFRRDLDRIYPLIDILVRPSIAESFGNSLIEAMAFGKPVVATRVGGMPEAVIDGKTGVLVPPEDVDALAEAILMLARNPSLCWQMGATGEERVRTYFTAERVVDEVESIYDRVIDSRRRKATKAQLFSQQSHKDTKKSKAYRKNNIIKP